MFFLLQPAAPADGSPPLAYPHPVITEVLYAVPTKNGDANRDGKRDTAADEFVELVNPHDRPINLKGYTIVDSGEGKSRFKFTFPAVALEPGQVAVVFNGNDAAIKGAVGDSTTAPVSGNDLFSGALVFTARVSSSRASWANKSDYVLLLAPNGAALECVYWGDEKKPPRNCPLAEQAPAVMRGSVQRARVIPDDEPDATSTQREAPSTAADTPASAPPGKPKDTDPKAKPKRETYKRKPPETPPGTPRKPPAMTFAAFEAHPALPGSLFGRAPDAEEGDQSVLFSPGVYPLDRLAQPTGEEDRGGDRVTDTTVGRPAKDSGSSPASVPARPNSGDPR